MSTELHENDPTIEALKDTELAGRRSLFTPSQDSAPRGLGRQLKDVEPPDASDDEVHKAYERSVHDVENGLTIRRTGVSKDGWESIEYENGLTIGGDMSHPLAGLGIEALEGKDV